MFRIGARRAYLAGVAAAVPLLNLAVGRSLMAVLQPSEARWEGLACHPLLHFNPTWMWGLLYWTPSATAAVAMGMVAAAMCGWGALRSTGRAAIAFALLLGWVLSGVADRLHYGAVVDFGVCGGGRATFNLADLAAALAVGLLLVSLAKGRQGRRRDVNNGSNRSPDDPGTV